MPLNWFPAVRRLTFINWLVIEANVITRDVEICALDPNPGIKPSASRASNLVAEMPKIGPFPSAVKNYVFYTIFAA